MLTEAIKAILLLARGSSRRPGGLCLERSVHALVSPILLGLAWIDALQLDAELHPMDRQSGQASRPVARKRRSIVRADRVRQAQLAEGLLEPGVNALGRGRHNLAGDQEAAVRIADRQRVATRAIRGAEPTLEVRTPDVVGCDHVQKRLRHRHRAALPPTGSAQALAPQQIANRACRRPPLPRMQLFQLRQQLERPKIGIASAHRDDCFGDLRIHAVGPPMRYARALHEPVLGVFAITRPPLVAGFPADPISLAQHRKRLLATQAVSNEHRQLVHGAGLFPRHRQISFAER